MLKDDSHTGVVLMKTRVCFSTEVVESDKFLSLSLESQLCYFHMCSEARPSGKVVGASRVIRSYGFGEDELTELLDNDYLLNCDGSIFIRDTWTNNTYEKRLFEIAMNGCREYKDGRLLFSGEEGKSAYRLANVSQTLGEDLPTK